MTRPIRLILFAIPTFTLFVGLGCKGRPKPPPPDDSPPIVTYSFPTAEPISRYAYLTGKIEAAETVQVRARVSGYIQRVAFKDGAEVKEGDLLFEIDPVPYQASLDQAVAKVKNFDAQLAQSKAEAIRVKDLADKDAVSANEVDIAIAKQAVNEAELEGAKAEVTDAKQNLEWTKVTAPISGRIDRAYYTKGNVATGGLTEGTVLTTIVSVEPMFGYFDADESSVLSYQRLVAANKATSLAGGNTLPIDIQFTGETDYAHSGTIDFVANRINPSTGSLQIRGTFPNDKRSLIPGQFCRGRIQVGDKFEGLLIPESAIVSELADKVVYVVDDDNKIVAKPIQLGWTMGNMRVIESGLSPDDRIVVRGMQRVKPGTLVDPEPVPGAKRSAD